MLTLKGLEPSHTYLDKLPKDLVWYMLGYTGPQDGYMVLKTTRNWIGQRKYTELIRATTIDSLAELQSDYSNNHYNHYGPQYEIAKVKFIFIDGKQYAAVPVRKKIYGYTPPKSKRQVLKVPQWRCAGRTTKGRRCKNKTKNATKLCPVHRT